MYNSSSLECLVPDSFGLKSGKSGPLSGITFVVKDNIAISGHVSSFGSSRWRETHGKSTQNASVISKISDNGGDIVGLAKLDQLTFSLVGNISEGEPPINPLYPDRFTGGSSSGTVSAVAGGIAQVGIGTDTGGSIRVPAAACGLYALRPSHGMIDCSGILPLAESFDTVGIVSMNIELIKKTFNVIRSDQKLFDVKVKRVILPADILKTASEEVGKVVNEAAIRIAKALGASLAENNFERFLNVQFADLFTRMQGREIWGSHSAWIVQNEQFLFPDVRMRLRRAEQFYKMPGEEIEADRQVRNKYTEDLSKYLGNDAIVVLPIMYGLPPKRNASDDELLEFRKMALRFTSPAGLSGFPEAVMPVKSARTGLTYGAGILGPKGSDLSLLDTLIAVSKTD